MNDKVRKCEEVLAADDGGFNRKKNKSMPPMEIEITKKEDDTVVSEVSTELLGMECSNL